MNPRKVVRAACIFAAMLAMCSTAQAALFRAYLASYGNDGNACTLASPCRLLPAALATVDDGGEIWMLDSANYNSGPVIIAKSVTILAVPGALGSVVALNGSAIVINTAGIEVTLRNLVIVPVPGGNGLYGIAMTAGDSLTVDDCVVAGHSQSGILVQTAATARITDSTMRENASHGLWLRRGARATVTRSTFSANGNSAIVIEGETAGSLTTADIIRSTIDGGIFGVNAVSADATAPVKVSVRNSRFVRSVNFGMVASSTAGAAVTLSANDNLISNNGTGVIAVDPGAKVWVSGNTVSDNGTGFHNIGAVFESAGNNAMRNNTTADTTGTIGAIATK